MTIECYSVGRFKEIVVHDFEDDACQARSGLLSPDDASDLAVQLRELAEALGKAAVDDDNQAVLPFVLEPLAFSHGFDRVATG